ncbi:MAG TPA: lysophospholipid acyltransferase family protein [Rhizomicrobium sp.]|nr:lysophospholipid acyltransferase family protein [Rhizomicrobium sp.]
MMLVLLRSAVFFVWFATVSTVLSLLFLPLLLLPPRLLRAGALLWCRASLWGLKVIAGMRMEVRGTPPATPMLVAAKHMSMWDTMALYLLLGKPAIVFKRELGRIPFYGWFLRKTQMISIDRDGKASALRKMAADAQAVLADGRCVLIFPEGTRKKPGAVPDYKPGVAGLYTQLGVPCAPVALNSGLFWTGPGGFLKMPGSVLVEFLPPIAPGLKRAAFMPALESGIETAAAGLIKEGRAALAEKGLAPPA